MDELEKKSSKLIQKFSGTIYETEVSGWCKSAEELLLVKALKNQDGAKFLFKVFIDEIKKIDQQLIGSNSAVLPDYERDLMLIKKEFFKKFVDFFETSDKTIAEMEKRIDSNL